MPSVNPEVTTGTLAASPDIDKDRHREMLHTLCQITTGHAGLKNIKRFINDQEATEPPRHWWFGS